MSKQALPLGTLLALFTIALTAALPAADLLVTEGQKIVFLGDSITQQGFNNPAGYVNLVIKGFEANGLHLTPLPAGISGQTSKDMLARIQRDVIDKKPDWVTISCGVNDVWHGVTGVEFEPYKINMTAMVDQCQAAGIKVVLLTATMIGEDQANANNQKLIPYNDFLRQLAKDKKCLLADLNQQMQKLVNVPEGQPPRNGNLLTRDGVHMNGEGNVMMASGILKTFGLQEAQIAKAVEVWLDIPEAFEVAKLSVSIRQYKKLKALAEAKNITVTEMVNMTLNKSLAELISQAP